MVISVNAEEGMFIYSPSLLIIAAVMVQHSGTDI